MLRNHNKSLDNVFINQYQILQVFGLKAFLRDVRKLSFSLRYSG